MLINSVEAKKQKTTEEEIFIVGILLFLTAMFCLYRLNRRICALNTTYRSNFFQSGENDESNYDISVTPNQHVIDLLKNELMLAEKDYQKACNNNSNDLEKRKAKLESLQEALYQNRHPEYTIDSFDFM